MENATMQLTQFVFLLGLSHAGKDTVGQLFVDKGYTRVSFGDAMKQEYADSVGIDVKILHEQGPEKEKHRQAMIDFAEAKRKIDSKHWIDKAIAPYLTEHGHIKEGLKLVFTDVRRKSEINWLMNFKYIQYLSEETKGGELLMHYIDAKVLLLERDVYDADVLSHNTLGYAEGLHRASEFPIIDALLDNNCTPDELKSKVARIFKDFAF